MTGIVGALIEAWDELRVHKLRVLLALIGVAVAVAAITTITAAGDMLRQVSAEMNERWTGRPATLTVSAFPIGTETPPRETYVSTFREIADRYAIEYSSVNASSTAVVRFPEGARGVMVAGVDTDYGVMHRFVVAEGRWFVPSDADRLSPALIVNEAFLDALGGPTIASHPTVTLGGDNPVVATVIGSYPNAWPEAEPEAYALTDTLGRWATPEDLEMMGPPSAEFWVPEGLADPLTESIRRDVTAAVPEAQADVSRLDQPGYDVLDGATRWVVLGVSVIALLLGGLGLVNIALVTVRYRIREIGIRRSFGAGSGRVFFGVLMESVVATVVAGFVGVSAAIIVLSNVPLDSLMGSTVEDRPGFPVSAAVTGMIAAVSVGALAGLIPALVAVRVKVIDAIRY